MKIEFNESLCVLAHQKAIYFLHFKENHELDSATSSARLDCCSYAVTRDNCGCSLPRQGLKSPFMSTLIITIDPKFSFSE